MRLLLLAALMLVGCSTPPQPVSSPVAKTSGLPPLLSLVMLMPQPREYQAEKLQAAVELAFGEKGKLTELKPQVTQVELSDGWVLLVHHWGNPYADPEEMKRTVESLEEVRLKTAFKEHKAWWSVDFVKQPGQEDPYRKLGKLVAALDAEDVSLLYCPEQGLWQLNDLSLLATLKGDKPLDIFGVTVEPEVRNVEKDDPAMLAAFAEARKTFPKFRQSFSQKAPGRLYYVKGKFEAEDGYVEYMWVEVLSMDDKVVRGHLENQPLKVKLKPGDEVQLPVAEVCDWGVMDEQGKILEGGFTVKALE